MVGDSNLIHKGTVLAVGSTIPRELTACRGRAICPTAPDGHQNLRPRANCYTDKWLIFGGVCVPFCNWYSVPFPSGDSSTFDRSEFICWWLFRNIMDRNGFRHNHRVPFKGLANRAYNCFLTSLVSHRTNDEWASWRGRGGEEDGGGERRKRRCREEMWGWGCRRIQLMLRLVGRKSLMARDDVIELVR